MNAPEIPLILLDTDIGDDCDDAGAMALLHTLCRLGEARLLAVTHCYDEPCAAGCIESINAYYGSTVPVGVNHEKHRPPQVGDTYGSALCRAFARAYPLGSEAPDALAVMRNALSCAPDHSVTMVTVGYLSSVARLIDSPADGISPLTGRELVAQKVTRLVSMAGRFGDTPPIPEFNVYCDIASAQTVCEKWPVELVLLGWEMGDAVRTFGPLSRAKDDSHPVARAYQIWSRLHDQGLLRGRSSWDPFTILEAVRPGRYFRYAPSGKIQVDDTGATTLIPSRDGLQTFLRPKEALAAVGQVIDELVTA